MILHDLKKRYSFVILHILVWFVFIFTGTLNRIALNPHTKIHIIDILLNQLPSIYVFYGSNYVFRRFLHPKRYFLLIVAEGAFFFSYVLFTWLDGYQLFPLLSP